VGVGVLLPKAEPRDEFSPEPNMLVLPPGNPAFEEVICADAAIGASVRKIAARTIAHTFFTTTSHALILFKKVSIIGNKFKFSLLGCC
jgi:hypothetical protein